MSDRFKSIRLLLALALSASAFAASAALGQPPGVAGANAAASAPSAVKMQALTATAANSAYTVHETTLESGTIVREYATPAGVVFAVSWQGPVLPDLSALLGPYFKTFKLEAERIRLSGRRGGSLSIAHTDLVIHSGGRMRDFSGHAYAPALVPAGVKINDVLR
ncbi:MAG: DUF2844 domain-containing protein [Gammaproteobacteria bacterium]|uniref:DUF2844 domain-containing protein n=1 Tax=Rhodoferax sp. TaxID=50421 RepID=UPI001D553CAA|nr:DUF2844 domain-containing protein [Rhodoferax sp.]MBU3899809.1 DUF2844 domain-containing protein [Gammaproteobacteria bacterium]MBU3998840.1 DUF2844 domain-containing protein [Gammaproteobacteria bacterium]MBU4019073.1 DUF2844 domain-containing protein [Gammaproteobacteria bacterium]MBU4078792.1 DUF2844 domain-containing protein [Gammaproteobacteria bacterium]MBU4112733.1 DUF2844 domain-containing protein [Gammaproteobacteria bacterium]